MKTETKRAFTRLILTAFLVLFLASLPASAETDFNILIIAHDSVPLDAINKETVERIYLGKKRMYSNDEEILPVVMKSGDVHEKFLKDYVGKTSSQFETYWKKQIFSGKGSAPKSFKTEKDLVKYVARTRGAIGYISSDTKHDSVKVLNITNGN